MKPVADRQLRNRDAPALRPRAGKWRFAVIMIANVWLVFLMMRYGTSRQQADAPQAAVQQSPAATLIASVVLVGCVLAVVACMSNMWRSHRHGASGCAIFRDSDDHSEPGAKRPS